MSLSAEPIFMRLRLIQIVGFVIFGVVLGLSSIELSIAQTNGEKPKAEFTRELPEEIKKLVDQLGSSNVQTREAAAKGILKIGDDALPHLEVAMIRAENLELKRRAEGLHAEIAEKAPSPVLPEGVIHIKLPPGVLEIKPTKVNGKSMIRITAGKSLIETSKFYLGDRWGCTQFEIAGDVIHWIPPKGGMGDTLAGMVKQPGTAYYSQSFVALDQLKAGSVLLTSPSFVFRWGKDGMLSKYPGMRHID
jgi:hypothetical protein